MSELRLNLISREWVIIPQDGARQPADFRKKGNRKRNVEYEPSCPFCKGNESKTLDDIIRYPAEGGWRMRVIPNKFPYLASEGPRERVNDGLRRKVSGVGQHEVIIESPYHNVPMALMPRDDVESVLNLYRDRFRAAFDDRRIYNVIIYKNHGPESGTTIIHPHSQLIGAPVIPLEIRYRVDEAMRYFDNTGQCIMCATMEDELRDSSRVVISNESFMTFVPFAALSPFHMWIFPKRHMPSFANTTDDELIDLAAIVKETLARLYFGLDDPSFNMVLRSLSPYRSRSEYIHWYISIVPRVTSTPGFEMGTGIYVNPSIPEEVAEFLRDVKLPD